MNLLTIVIPCYNERDSLPLLIEKLSPFGPGNSEPKFMVENLSLVSSYVVKNSHIKSILRGNDGSIIKSFL